MPDLPGYVMANELYLRLRPTSDPEDVILTLHKDDVVGLINRQGNYYFVWVPALDEYGYVLSKYIKTDHDQDIPHINTVTPKASAPTPAPTPTPSTPVLYPGEDNEFPYPTLPPYA